ncbi:MAG: glycosyltransferase family 4 protein [Ignavibacteria bacterium]
MKSPKIVFLGRYNQSEILTGPEKVAKRIFFDHTKENSSVFIEYFFDGTKFNIFKKIFGSEKVTEVNSSPVFRKGIFSLLKFLFLNKPDIIHIITYERFCLTAVLYKFLSNVKIIYNIHGIVAYENSDLRDTKALYKKKDEYAESKLFKYSDLYLFLSDQSIQTAENYYHITESKIRMIANGVDIDFHKDIQPEKDIEKEFKIVFSGDPLRKEKGYDLIKEVFYELNFPFRLYLLSNQKIYKENFIINLKPMDTNTFAEFLSDADIIISSADYEPFSMTVTEAMSSGAVPVVSKETGMSRYIKECGNGFIFDTKNPDELKLILTKIYSDPELLFKLSQNAKKIYDQLNWGNVYNDYKKIYSKLYSGL